MGSSSVAPKALITSPRANVCIFADFNKRYNLVLSQVKDAYGICMKVIALCTKPNFQAKITISSFRKIILGPRSNSIANGINVNRINLRTKTNQTKQRT